MMRDSRRRALTLVLLCLTYVFALTSTSSDAQTKSAAPIFVDATEEPESEATELVNADLAKADFANAELNATELTEALRPEEAAALRQKREKLNKAAAGAYKPVFYDNDFRYLKDPDYDGHFLGDRLKQMHFGDCWVVDIGGQYRARYQGENNFRGLGLTGRDDDFLLHRTRLFSNIR